MNNSVRDMLLSSSVGKDELSVWDIVLHSLMTNNRKGIAEIADYMDEFPHSMPSDFEQRIKAINKEYQKQEISQKLWETKREEDKYYQRLEWQKNEAIRLAYLARREAELESSGIPKEDYFYHLGQDMLPHPEPS